MNKPFEPNKTIQELGIDITREFVVVKPGNFFVGDILTLKRDDDSYNPFFKRKSDGKVDWSELRKLAYMDREEITWDNIEVGNEIEHPFSKNREKIVDYTVNKKILFFKSPNGNTDFAFAEEIKKRGWTIVQPNKVEEMTKEQVCKELGREVKIIK